MHPLKQSILAAVGTAIAAAVGENVISLVGDNWTLSNSGLSISVPGRLPSQAHLDLYAAQVIGDPLHDLNDFNLRWIAYSNWTYTSDYIAGIDGNASSTWLRFDGLDTFASIYMCDQFVAYTDNQFRQYWFNVTTHLEACKPGEEVVRLEFGSAPAIANSIAAQSGQETYPSGIQSANEFGNVYYIRKEQNDFGWDWGPSFAPAGPWQPAYVIQLDDEDIHVRNVDVDIYKHGQLPLIPPDQSSDWIVNASIDYFGSVSGCLNMTYTLKDFCNNTVSTGYLSQINQTGSSITGATTIAKDSVDLWWPNGLGEQVLYYLTVNVTNDRSELVASVTRRTGFRTIVLNMAPISSDQLAQGIAPGNNWKFEINGHEFYALGSNFIPPDPFWPNVTIDRMARLFDSVVQGNQNMLRVWSSGAYSPDFIYDLADERGILLWSEFEFSDHLYPVDQGFLDNVYQEAEYNVRRVNHHPSLALWAGGNELESLMLESIVKSVAPDKYDQYVSEYEKLFISTLSPAVLSNSRSISYTPTSTGNGWLTLNYSADPLRPFTERYLNKTAGSIYGDTDYYNYDPNILGDLSSYPVGRFSNEFGFLSLPSLQSWRQQVSEDQLYLGSKVTTLRCHHNVPGINDSNYDAANTGVYQMMDAVERWYPTPNKTDRLTNFTAWIYATQVFQADLYTSEIEFYRRGSGMPERQLGSLYWQLNDMWAAPTWASIEVDGRWKLLHYAAKDIYEPVIIAPYYNSTTGQLTAYVTSSLWETISGNAVFTWYDWAGQKVNESTADFTVGAINTTKVLDINVNSTQSFNDLVLKMSVTAEGRLPNTDIVRSFRHENWFHASALKDAPLVDPGLILSYDEESSNFTVTATQGIAAFVWLDHPGNVTLTFDSNGFWLARDETRQVSYDLKDDTTAGQWPSHVTVQSIWNLTLSE